ncbi:hypothetical protein [Haloplanus halophilus]|uniref:hypothetical protein n=1 Tax=Haloplanus halophilus TaxID=2949993 RepID=UPI002040B852|nr:hypothetical protein [Haloplanus sp. GDY1]
MPSITRRRALQGAVALVAGFAGCSGDSSSSTNYPSEADGNIAFDPRSYRLRTTDPGPLVWTGERPTPEGDEERAHYRHHVFVASPEEADAVSFADVDGADGAREFLDATDYDAETVFVEQWTIEECFTPNLCYVQWSETDVETSYARRYRDAHVHCEADAQDTIATLIRIPAAFDPSDVNSYGSSYGSSTCERENELLRRRRNESDGSGGGRP